MLESTFKPTKEKDMDSTYCSVPGTLNIFGEKSPQHCCVGISCQKGNLSWSSVDPGFCHILGMCDWRRIWWLGGLVLVLEGTLACDTSDPSARLEPTADNDPPQLTDAQNQSN